MNTTQDTFQNHYYKDNQGNIYVGDWCEGLTEITEEEFNEIQEINQLKQEEQSLTEYLLSTNHQAINCYTDGTSMEELHPESYEKRLQARARINEIRELLKANP